MKRTVCVVTGSRSEYDLLYQLLKEMRADGHFILRVAATGMHLSPAFGNTYREIEKDGFRISGKVKIPLSDDSAEGITRSIGLGVIGFAGLFEKMKPDAVILLGDRFEIFSAAIAAFTAKVPIMHIHGGEVTEGVMDDAMRHSITKMSTLHFVAAEQYRRRVIQMGESPRRVFNVGALGIDNVKNVRLMPKDKLECELKFKFGKPTVLVTFHPLTLEDDDRGKQFKELLKALDDIKDLKVIFTKPNADARNKIITKLIDGYVRNNPDRSTSFISLGRVRYLSSVSYADAVVGNSSSGIIEVPSMGRPTVNIGSRQKGRERAKTVIDCDPERSSIRKAIYKALSPDFQKSCKKAVNPYGKGGAARRITGIMTKRWDGSRETRKSFYDLSFLTKKAAGRKGRADV